MSKIEVDTIEPQSGTTLTLGASGDTITIPSGATITNSGTATGFGGTNTPAFEVYLSANQTVTDNTYTKIQFNTEVFDTNSYYDNSTNYRFTPLVAGKYYVYSVITAISSNGDSSLIHCDPSIYKNGSVYRDAVFDFRTNYVYNFSTFVSAIVDMNGTTDYLEVFASVDVTAGSAIVTSSNKQTYFGAYKIIE